MPDSLPPPDGHERRLLILVSGAREGQLTLRLLEAAGLQSLLCAEGPELLRELDVGAGALLLAEEALTPSLLQGLRAFLSRQPAWSDLPIVIFSAASRDDNTRLAASSALGNVTFMDRPVHVRTMMASIHAALRSRSRQYEARRAIESRDAFLALLGHELRNPLGAITLAVAALERKTPTGPLPPEYGILERQLKHLSRLVDELLDVARVTNGKVSLARRQVDLAELAKGSFESVEPRARERDLAYTLRISERPLFVLGDRQRLEQVIGNLLTNAVKYTPRGGSVALSVEAAEGRAHIAVVDNGVGLAQEMLDRVFEPFAQVESSLDRSQGGLGLGLALVQSLVALHGGTVCAKSAGIGKGCRFELELPRLLEPEAAPQPVSTSMLPPPLLRIVLVEDNLDIRELFAESLQDWGHTVEAAMDGPSGLDAVLTFRPDVAFVDVGLPGFDGYELARRVRASGSHARLVALTGYGQREDKQRAAEAGFDEHLVKPVRDDDLREALLRASA